MKRFLIALVLLTSVVALAKDNETLDQLKARAEATKKPDVYAELSRRQIEQANELYNTDVDAAKKMIDDGVQSAVMAGKLAVDTGKDLKKTEIRLRKLYDRLLELRRSWAFEDRQPLKDGAEKIDEARSKLLDRMFKK